MFVSVESDDDGGGGGSGGVEAPPTATPTVPHRHSETESGQVTDTTTGEAVDSNIYPLCTVYLVLSCRILFLLVLNNT